MQPTVRFVWERDVERAVTTSERSSRSRRPMYFLQLLLPYDAVEQPVFGSESIVAIVSTRKSGRGFRHPDLTR